MADPQIDFSQYEDKPQNGQIDFSRYEVSEAAPPGVPKPPNPIDEAANESRTAGLAGVPGGSPHVVPASNTAIGLAGAGLATAGAVVGGPPAIRAIGAAAAKHPMLTSMIASEGISQARRIPVVGKFIPPYSEMLPYLLSGGKGEPEGVPEHSPIPAKTDQIPGRPYMPNPRYEPPVETARPIPPRSGLLLEGEVTSSKPLGPEKPPPEVFKARGIATGGKPAPPEPSAGLGKIPVPKVEPEPVIPAAIPKAEVTRTLDKTLPKALGNEPPPAIRPGVKIRDQFKPAIPESSVQGHIPVESSAVKSFKYDPATKQLEVAAKSGGEPYVYAEVTPAEADAFKTADSKGTAWKQIRDNHVQIGKAGAKGITPRIPDRNYRSASPEDDMTADLEKSVEIAKKKKQ